MSQYKTPAEGEKNYLVFFTFSFPHLKIIDMPKLFTGNPSPKYDPTQLLCSYQSVYV